MRFPWPKLLPTEIRFLSWIEASQCRESEARCRNGRQELGRRPKVCAYGRRRFPTRSMWWIWGSIRAIRTWHVTFARGHKRTEHFAISVAAIRKLPFVRSVEKSSAWRPVRIAWSDIQVATSVVRVGFHLISSFSFERLVYIRKKGRLKILE